MLAETCKLVLKGNTFETKKVTIDTIIRIDQLKIQLSGGNYSLMYATNMAGMRKTIDYIDMFAVLIALMPESFFKALNTPSQNLLELHPDDAKELFSAYEEQMLPWVVAACNLLK